MGHGTPHFFAFPDCEAAVAVARRLERERPGLRTVAHGSGRPWIIGAWADEDLVVARAGRTAVALIGTLPPVGDEPARRAVRLRTDASALDGLAGSLPGDFHLLSSADGLVRVQGTGHGSRRVFHTRAHGTWIASDRAAALAGLTGAEPDAAALALRLLHPLPAPLDERVMWHGLTAVPPGELLELPVAAPPRQLRWHQPPEPRLPLAEGAEAVREALVSAVRARTHRTGLISADLSGGMDSTSVCAIAARERGGGGDTEGTGKLIVCTATGDETENEDGHWARTAATEWPGVEHVELPRGELPLFYSGVLDDDCRTDAPSMVAVCRDRATTMVSRMAERGSRLHLTGYGGDHLFLGSATQYHALLPRRPLLTLQRLRGYRTLYGWPWRAVLRELADRRSYRRSLARTTARVTARRSGSVDIGTPSLGWMRQPVVPGWLTPDCLRLIETELREAVETAEPYGATPGRHIELAAIRGGTQELRSLGDAALRAGVPLANPYFDDRVVDAALAVRIEDRATPWAYKPLLAEAVRGITPEPCLTRTTKGDGTPDAVGGLYRHRDELAALWEDSALAGLGLVDAGALRRICAAPGSPELKDGAVNTTLFCEAWLRSAR